jgi:hypothetical protein
MKPVDTANARRLVRRLLAGSLAASVVLLLMAALLADIHMRVVRRFRVAAIAGILAILFSQGCYLLLVWSGWTTESLLWRLWWISMVASVNSTHVLLLRKAAVGRGDWVERGTPICVWLFGVMVMGLAAHRHVPPDPGPIYLWCMAVPGVLALVGSFVAWRRRPRTKAPPTPMSLGAKITWLTVSHVALLLLGWYVGRTALPKPGSFDTLPSALARLTAEQLDAQVYSDLKRLKQLGANLGDLTGKSEELGRQLGERLRAEQRAYYLPEEEDQIRWQFMTYLWHRAELRDLVATYAGFEVVPDTAARARCAMVGYAAAMTTFRTSLHFITMFRDQPLARRKLNEPGRELGIPAGMFDRVYESVTNERNLELCAEMAAYFELKRSDWRAASVFPLEDFDWLEKGIGEDLKYVREHRLDRHKAWFDLFFERVKMDAKTPVYAAQSRMAEWIGDTRIARRPPFISVDQIENTEPLLKPGDILLERRNWSLSNAFLPGFWPHAALYIGNLEDLRRLGVVDPDKPAQVNLEEYLKPAPDGGEHTVIESLSEGVIFNSLTESMHADYIAVLRPRLAEAEIAAAIVEAFKHQGKPYDFEFDFFTSDKLVCTELVYRAYEGMLHFDLVRVMGRDTLPALELARKYARERGRENRELDFVLFLDAVQATGRARRATEEEFCESADRPRAFNE